MQFYSVNTG